MGMQYRYHAPGAMMVHDRDLFSRHVLASPSMRAHSLARGQAGASLARQLAPVETGEYRESIEARAELRHGQTGFDDGHYGRQVAVVEAGTDHAKEIEYGNRDQAGRHVMATSMAMLASGGA